MPTLYRLPVPLAIDAKRGIRPPFQPYDGIIPEACILFLSLAADTKKTADPGSGMI